jgi:hypothetical protein
MKGRKKLESRDGIVLANLNKERGYCVWQSESMAEIYGSFLYLDIYIQIVAFELVSKDRNLAGLTHGSSPPPAPTEFAAYSWRVIDQKRRRSLWLR